MTRPATNVTVTNQPVHRLPDWAAEPVALILSLKARDLLDSVADEVRVRREGGYAGFDVFVFLLFYFAGRISKGIRLFWEDDARSHATSLGAVAGRKRLASSSALSRALADAEFEHTRRFGPWLLRTAAGVGAVMRHPAAQTYDTTGQAWHTFDFDPTVHALRHRALPDGDDLPAPRRRSAASAAPGYSGRKRGDVQLRRSTLQHSGSAIWLDVQVAPGNGDNRAELARALDVAADVMDELDAPRSRGMFRADGAFGHVPGITAARKRQLAFLSRLTRPDLLDQPEVREHLTSATWTYVPDSGSGPRRSATDLGLVTLTAAAQVLQDDGSPFEPVTARVVVSRFPTKKGRGRGRAIAGWRYELYVADGLEPDAWPAAEVVAEYYGRAAEENRFGQEDRELCLDRIFSYHLPGQELATLVALFVWNLRVGRGFELDPPPEVAPPQPPRARSVDERHLEAESRVDSEVMRGSPANATSTPGSGTVTTDDAAGVLTKAIDHLKTELEALQWPRLLARRPGWSWRTEDQGIRCPQGETLTFTTVRVEEEGGGRGRLHFRGPKGVCHRCALHEACYLTAGPSSVKQLAVVIAKADAEALRNAQGRLRSLRGRKWRSPLVKTKGMTEPVDATPSPSESSKLKVQFPDAERQPGMLTVVDPLLLPATARRTFHRATQPMDILVDVRLPAPPSPRPVLVASCVADRQHRRLSWLEHTNRYALPPGTTVEITLQGGGRLSSIVGLAQGPPVQMAASY